MKKYFLIFCAVLAAHPGFASEIWVTVPGLTTREKLSRLAVQPRENFKDVSMVSSFEALLRHPVEKDKWHFILSLEAQAETAVLQGRFEEALKIYGQVISEMEKIPNVYGLEKVTLNALIRRADLHFLLKKEDSQNLWREAHAFNPQARLSPEQYSPRIVQTFRSLKNLSLKPLDVEAPPESEVFVDGRRIQSLEKGHFTTHVESGHHQVSVLFPGGFWQVMGRDVSSQENPRPLIFKAAPLVTGDCDQPQYEGPALPSDVKLLASFNDGACERVYDDDRWFSVQGRTLNPPETAQKLAFGESAKPLPGSWFSQLIHSPWFWVGAGAVTAGAIVLIKQNQEQPPVVVPTHTLQ